MFRLFAYRSSGGRLFSPKAIGLDLACKALLYEPRTVAGSQHFLVGAGAVSGTYNTTFHVGFAQPRTD